LLLDGVARELHLRGEPDLPGDVEGVASLWRGRWRVMESQSERGCGRERLRAKEGRDTEMMKRRKQRGEVERGT
jgi:hypothetical protein